MRVEVKEWPTLDKKGSPRGFMFNRLIHGGDVFDIPDTQVVHEIHAEDDEGKPMMKDGKPVMERKVRHHINVSHNPLNPDHQDMTELEYRRHIIKTSNLAQRWSAEEKALYLKYQDYSPEVMRKVQDNKQVTVNPEDSMPSAPGRDPGIPDLRRPTSVGNETTKVVASLKEMSEDAAITLVNKTSDAGLLDSWKVQEKSGNRNRLKAVIDAQLRTATESR